MIDDPIPWKEELVRIAHRLEAKTKQKRWTDRTEYLIERDFVMSAYAMRKLIESGEVSGELRERKMPVRRFEVSEMDPDDFENGRRWMLPIANVCQEIVHSSVFTFCCGETDDLFDGVFVSSDRRKNKYVYLVLASDFIALCCDIARPI